ncbi:OmpP1/FadL family transporter [Parasediminibacterium sp. JCM 36343]|uniref:OmpP1/FadL family transporter n=1 Tax=Parasediminibacterium sp. JCM 36343 TaxID=3374279 RepID=UPI00397C880C
MKFLVSLSALLVSLSLFSQTPDDALRTAWFTGNGTARNVALGGAMGSLGGDITAANTNPAGLAIYKTSEWVVSPGYFINNNKFNYRGTDTSSSKNKFVYEATGVVFAIPNHFPRNSWVSQSISLSVNQLASYNNRIQYRGFNNASSFSEQYLEELQRDGADTLAALSNYIFGSSLAFRTYLIDTVQGAGGSVAGFQSLVPLSSGVIQNFDAITRGGYHEIAIGYAGNHNDKFYMGASLTIPIISYKRELVYSETDATNDTTNQFKNFTYKENFSSSGAGIGAKLGFIYKPADSWRFGFAFHTPQAISYKDQIRSSMVTNTESYAHTVSENSDNLNEGNAGTREYVIYTPYRAIASASYIFGAESDTRQQRGFISADVEFVNYRGARFGGKEAADQTKLDYLKLVNNAIKSYYKSNINARIGAELKLNVFMFRLGAAYYGSPYADKNIKASKTLGTAGIGYRNHGMFIDIAYSHAFIQDANFPYRLNDKKDTYAIQKGSLGNAVLTVGFKF